MEYRSWVIESTPTCIVLHKRSDVRDTHVGYFSSIESALSRLFEILLQKNAKSGKGAKNIGSLRNAILQTRQEFEQILSLNIEKDTNNTIEDKIKEGVKKKKDEIRKDAYQEGWDKALSSEEYRDTNWYNGFKEGLKYIRVCPRCKKTTDILSIHHIIPRSKGGGDFPENLIGLCKKCHDDVEMFTDEMFEKGGLITKKSLKSFILNGFPTEKDKLHQLVEVIP